MPDPRFAPPAGPALSLEGALAAAHEIVVLVDRQGIVRWASRSFASLFGWPETGVVGRHLAELALPPHTIDRALRHLEQVAAAGTTLLFEEIVPTPFGLRHLHYSLTPVAGDAGETSAFLAIARDVTAQRQQDAFLREREELFRQVFERGPLGIVVSSPDRRILRANERFWRLLGYSEGELAGLRIEDLTHPDDREPVRRTPSAPPLAPEAAWSTGPAERPTAAAGEVSAGAEPAGPPGGSGTGGAATGGGAVQPTASAGTGGAGEGEGTAGPAIGAAGGQGPGTPMGSSPGAGTGQERAPGMEDRPAGASETGAPAGHEAMEVRFIRRDGHAVWVQLTRALVTSEDGEVRYVLTMVEDIDQRKRAAAEQRAMEERLREMQKLESLGVLAGGIAHDFNNLLVPILGNAELALQELPPASPVHGYLREIVAAAERAAELARQMLAYSGRGRFVSEATDLSLLIRDMEDLLRASVARGLALELDLAPDLPPVDADAGQLRQLVLNLVLNASEAVGSAAGRVVVRTGRRHVTRDFLESAHLAADLPEGDYVFLEVRDTGAGMADSVRARVFDPFFTTKSPGRGLGLPAVLGVVRAHHGAIGIESEVGRGTTVTVILPPVRLEEQESAARYGEGTTTARGTTVLIVEDDAAVRALAARTLERAGFKVLTAANGAEAVDLMRQRWREVGCVLLDVMTPQLRGLDACRAIKALAPRVQIVAMSGFAASELSGELGPLVAGVLQKPFTPAMLRDAVSAALAT